MLRRKFTALWASALLTGLMLGVAPGVTQVWAKSALPPSEEPQLESKSSQTKPQPAEKKAPPARCKLTKDCQKGQVCQKAGDHKECVAPPLEAPQVPVVT